MHASKSLIILLLHVLFYEKMSKILRIEIFIVICLVSVSFKIVAMWEGA